MIKQVYLQEKDFPQSCTECEYYTVGRVCKLFKAPVWSKCGTERDEACPLHSLEHYKFLEKLKLLNIVRKEVNTILNEMVEEVGESEWLQTFVEKFNKKMAEIEETQ